MALTTKTSVMTMAVIFPPLSAFVAIASAGIVLLVSIDLAVSVVDGIASVGDEIWIGDDMIRVKLWASDTPYDFDTTFKQI